MTQRENLNAGHESNDAPLSEREKAMREELRQAHAEIDNLKMNVTHPEVKNHPDAMRAREFMIKRIDTTIAPSLPRMIPGKRFSLPMVAKRPAYANNVRARAFADKYTERRYLDRKAPYFQHFPKRYVPMLPRRAPAPVVTKAPLPYRTRYNKIDGQYYEIYDAATNSYKRGPTIISQANLVENARNREHASLVMHGAARRVVADYNRSRTDTKWVDLDKNMRNLASRGFDPYEIAPRSVRAANDAKSELSRKDYNKREMPVAQARAFGDYLDVRGVSPDLKWEKDKQGNIVVKRKTDKGTIVEKISLNGDVTEDPMAAAVENFNSDIDALEKNNDA